MDELSLRMIDGPMAGDRAKQRRVPGERLWFWRAGCPAWCAWTAGADAPGGDLGPVNADSGLGEESASVLRPMPPIPGLVAGRDAADGAESWAASRFWRS